MSKLIKVVIVLLVHYLVILQQSSASVKVKKLGIQERAAADLGQGVRNMLLFLRNVQHTKKSSRQIKKWAIPDIDFGVGRGHSANLVN